MIDPYIQPLQWFTLALGAVSILLPLYLAWYWWPDREGVGRVFSWAMLSEAYNMIVAWYFALQSALTIYNDMGPIETMVLRWSLFIFAMFTTSKAVYFMRRNNMPLR